MVGSSRGRGAVRNGDSERFVLRRTAERGVVARDSAQDCGGSWEPQLFECIIIAS